MVQRANVVLSISPEDKEKFMEQGYSVIDEKGNVIEYAMPTDVPTLQKLVRELESAVKLKDEEIASLKKPRKSKLTETE